jgi:hypothetical protein
VTLAQGQMLPQGFISTAKSKSRSSCFCVCTVLQQCVNAGQTRQCLAYCSVRQSESDLPAYAGSVCGWAVQLLLSDHHCSTVA